jgi:hypothetical protein
MPERRDRLRPEFTLLRFDGAVDVTELEAAALPVHDMAKPRTATFYGGGLVLSRPDQQVAWRGGRLPTDPLALIDHVRGAAS